MERVKIAFAGGRALGVRTLEWLATNSIFDVVAVCPVPKDSDPDYYNDMMSVIDHFKLLSCDINRLKDFYIDMGLSVNYHRIIKQDILSCFNKGFYNVHHSYNLRLRGRNITTHAILNTLNENVYYHGTTLHLMVPELDAGGIVASESVSIDPEDTAYSLFNKTDDVSFEMITEWIPRIATQRVFLYTPPTEGVHSYKNSELPSREMNDAMSDEMIDTYIRAFDFPGKEPAYLMSDGRRIHLVMNKRDHFQKQYKINSKIYYSD